MGGEHGMRPGHLQTPDTSSREVVTTSRHRPAGVYSRLDRPITLGRRSISYRPTQQAGGLGRPGQFAADRLVIHCLTPPRLALQTSDTTSCPGMNLLPLLWPEMAGPDLN